MANSTDKRVIEMALENSNFERNAKVSMDTLDHLKKKMDFSEESKKGLNLDTLGNSIEILKDKFSTLGIIGMTALQNITNKAVDAGLAITKALTLDPVLDGFQEYELEMNSIQTILTNTKSKGTTIDDITEALGELNEYADLTVYNFADMTHAIGQFTTAGVDLERSVQAIKGFSNLAAGTGTINSDLKRAEYQLSQMLSIGFMSKQDWKSMENAGGIGGELFRNALVKNAREYYEGVKGGLAEVEALTSKERELYTKYLSETDKKTKNQLKKELLEMGVFAKREALDVESALNTISKIEEGALAFRESFDKQANSLGFDWLKTDVVIQTLNEFANDPDLVKAATQVKTLTQLFDTLREALGTGWGRSFKIILGDFSEATDLLTDVSDVLSGVINGISDSRNAMLDEWKELGGRDDMIEIMKNSWEALLSIVKPIKEAFSEIFPPMTGKTLADLTAKVKDFTANLILSTDQQEKLKAVARGVFSVFELGWNSIKRVTELLSAFGSKVLPVLTSVGSAIVDIVASLGNSESISGLFDRLIEFLSTAGDKISSAFQSFSGMSIDNAFSKAAESIKMAVEKIADAVAGFGKINTSGLDSFVSKIGDKLSPLTRIGELLQKAGDTIKPAITKIAEIFSFGFEKAKNAVSKILDSFSIDGVLNIAKSGLLLSLISNISSFVKGLTEIADSFSGIGEIFKSAIDVLDGVKEALESWQQTLKAQILIKIALAIGILAGSLYVLSTVDKEQLATATFAITAMFAELFGSIGAFEKLMAGSGFASIEKVTSSMVLLSVSVYILASAMKKIAELDSDQIANGLISIATMMAGIIISAKQMSSFLSNSKGLVSGAASMVVFAEAIKILAGVVKKLSDIDVAAMLQGLGGLAILMAELVAFFKMADFDNVGVTKGIGMMLMAESLSIIAGAVKKLGGLDLAGLAKGIMGMAVVLTEIDIFMNTIGDVQNLTGTAIGMVVLGAALNIMAGAVKSFGSMSLPELGKGLLGIGGALLIISGAMRLLPEDSMSIGAGLVVVGASLNIIASAVKNIGALSLSQLGTGLLGIGGALAIIAGAMQIIPKDTILIGAGLIAVGAALKIIASAVSDMGGMKWDEIGRGLVALAGSMVILSAAMYAMSGSIAGALAMVVMSAALAMFVPVLALLGSLPIEVIMAGLIGLAGAFTVIGVAAYLLSPLSPILLAFSVALVAVGAAVSLAGAGCLMFATAIAELAAVGAAGIGGLMLVLDAIVSKIPEVAVAIGQGFIGICQQIIQNAPTVMQAVNVFMQGIITSIVQNIPLVVTGIMQLITALLQALAENIPNFVKAGADFIVALLTGLGSRIPDIVLAALALVISFLKGIAAGIPQLIQGGIDIIVAIIDGLAIGLRDNRERVITAVHNLCVEIFKTVLSFFGIHSPSTKMAGVGENISEGLIVGVAGKNSDVKAAFEQMGLSGLSGLDSLDSAMNTKGSDMFDEYLNGLTKNQGDIRNSSSSIGEGTLDGLEPYESLMNNEGYDFSKAFGDGLGSNSGEITDVASLLGEAGIDGLNGYNSIFNTEGADLGAVLVDGLSSNNSGAKTAGTELGDNVKEGVDTHKSTMLKQGYELGDKLVDGIKKKHVDALHEGKVLAGKVVNGVNSQRVATDMRQAGKELVNGLVSGIKQNESKAENAGTELGKKVVKSTKKSLDIASPSKEMERIGKYTDEGLANGIKKFSNKVFGSVSDVNAGILGTFSSIISSIVNAMDDNMDLDPVIRPVLDLSSIESNASELNSMFSGETFKMANDNSYMMARDNAMNVANNQNLSINDTGIISAIDKLHNDMASLSERINNMQVVMDSGALVGQLFAPMDSEFGTRIYRNLREREA